MSSNIVWEWGRPRTIQGYWDMGSIQIPPLPQRIVLTDLASGLLSEVVHDGNNPGALSVITGTAISSKPDKLVYGTNDGPIAGIATLAGGVRVFGFRVAVTGGVLFYQAFGLGLTEKDRETAPVFVRTTLVGKTILIAIPTITNGVITTTPLNFSVITVP